MAGAPWNPEPRVFAFDPSPLAQGFSAFGGVDYYSCQWYYSDPDGSPESGFQLKLYEGVVHVDGCETAAFDGDYDPGYQHEQPPYYEGGLTYGVSGYKHTDNDHVLYYVWSSGYGGISWWVFEELSTGKTYTRWSGYGPMGDDRNGFLGDWTDEGDGFTVDYGDTEVDDTGWIADNAVSYVKEDLTVEPGWYTLKLWVGNSKDPVLTNGPYVAQLYIGVMRVNTPPVAGFTYPTQGVVASGTVTVIPTATDDHGLSKLTLMIDGNMVYEWYVSGIQQTSWSGSYTLNTLPMVNGTHFATIVAVDDEGLSTTSMVTFSVNNGVTGDTRPVVTITAPTDGTTVSGTAVTISSTTTDDHGIVSIITAVGGVVLDTWSPSNPQLAHDVSVSWDSTKVSNGAIDILVTATDTKGQVTTKMVTVTVANDTGGGPTGDDPEVEITDPVNDETVSDKIEVVVHATDDNALASINLYLDGRLVPPVDWEAGDDVWLSWWIETDHYGNGDHDLMVVAIDADGNSASHTINIDIDNSSATEPVLWVSCPWSDDPTLGPFLIDMISNGRKASRIEVSAIITSRANPENNYAIQIGVKEGQEWTSFDDCMTIIPDTVMKMYTPAEDGRIAILFTPLVAWDSWSIPNPDVIDIQVLDDVLYIMSRGNPAVIYSWDGTNDVETWLDLTDTWVENFTPVGFRICGDKVYIAANGGDNLNQPCVVVQDLDTAGSPVTSTPPYVLELKTRYPAQTTCIEVIDTKVYVGTDDGSQNGTIWSIDVDDVLPYSLTMPGISGMWADGSTIMTGSSNGLIYSGASLVDDTEQAVVNQGFKLGNDTYITTGNLGAVYRLHGSTATLFANADMQETFGVAYYYGRMWVGGSSPVLYSYDTAEDVWSKYKDFTGDGWYSINRLVEFNEMLVILGNNDGGVFKTLQLASSHLSGRFVDEISLAVVDTEEA